MIMQAILIALVLALMVVINQPVQYARVSRVKPAAIVAPPMPDYAPTNCKPEDVPGWECLCNRLTCEWCGSEDGFWCDEYDHAEACFNRLFAGVEVKRSKNGRLMVKGNYARTFKFAKKGQ